MDDDNKTPSSAYARNKEIDPVSAQLDDNTAINTQNINVGSGDETKSESKILSSNEGVNDETVDAVSSSMPSLSLNGNITEHKGYLLFFIF